MTRTASILAIASLVFAACGGTGPSAGSPWTTDCSDCESDDPGDPDDDTGDPGDGDDPPVHCTPQPRSASIGAPPELPEAFDVVACRPRTTSLERFDGNIRRLRSFDYGDEGRRVTVEATQDGIFDFRRTWRRSPEGELEEVVSTTSTHEEGIRETTEWNIDERGRVTRRHRIRHRPGRRENPQSTETIRVEWNGERPVKRIVESDGSDGSKRVVYEWTYRQGQLVGASIRGDTLSRSVEWSYRDGRPAEVRRSVDGVTYERQEWRYDEAGALESRTVEYSGNGLDGEIETPEWPRRPLLDSMAAGRTERRPFRRESWNSSEPSSDNSCAPLPSDLGFGYPTDAPAYRLAWKTGDKPDSIESTYRPLPFGQAPRVLETYGHVGAAAPDSPFRRWVRDTGRITATIRYDDRGRMHEVTATVRPDAESDRIEAKRLRSFENGNITSDRLVIRTDERKQVRTIDFEWSDGRLTDRALRIDEMVIERQHWRYPGSNTVELTLEVHPDMHNPRGWSSSPSLDPPSDGGEDELAHLARFRRELDDEGRPVRTVRPVARRRSSVGDTKEQARTWKYGPHGPTRRRTERPDDIRETTWEYDGRGRKIRRETDVDEDGSADAYRYWRYNADRLVEHKSVGKTGTTRRHVQRNYDCGS